MHPVLFRLPLVEVPVYSYGLMLALSLIVGWFLVLRLGELDGLPRERTGPLYLWTAVASVVSARLLFVATNPSEFHSLADVARVGQGGLVAYGGFLGGFGFGLVYCRAAGIKLLAWADCVVPALGTGLILTRVGCLLYGCDFGQPSSVAWAIRFPPGAPAFLEQVGRGLIDARASSSLPVHPTQIYESLIGLTLFLLTMGARRARRFSGEPFVAFTMGYGALRFLVEMLRADGQRGSIGALSTSQAIGLATFLLAAGLWAWLWRRWRRDPAAARHWERREPGRDSARSAPTRRRKQRR